MKRVLELWERRPIERIKYAEKDHTIAGEKIWIRATKIVAVKACGKNSTYLWTDYDKFEVEEKHEDVLKWWQEALEIECTYGSQAG